MNAYFFSVYQRQNRPFYFVQFKDENGNFLNPISTKKAIKKEAEQAAFKWLREGIPQKDKVVKVKDLTLSDMARKIKSGNEAEAVLAEMQKRGLLKNFILNDTPQAEDFISFLTTFWNWETSV